MSDLRLDAATPADGPAILALIRDLAEYERLSDACVATEPALHDALFGPRPAAEVILARIGDEVAGYALFFTSFSTFLAKPGIYLEDLFVRPAFRGRGIGRALLQHLAQLVVRRGGGRLEWAVLDWNEPALGFYRSLGAVPLDDWTVHRLSGDALHALAAGRATGTGAPPRE